MKKGLRSTENSDYTHHLLGEESAWWKKLLIDRQAPYRWNLRRLNPGFTLDVGCGLGRNLAHLDGRGVGIDHNPASVAVARERGLQAFTPDAFAASPFASAGRFDTLLVSHVLEHLTVEGAIELLRTYLPYVRDGGQAIVITPQEWGQRADASHVTFMDFEAVRGVFEAAGLEPQRQFSFPFPRAMGHVFRFNEFVTVGRKRPSA